MKLTEDKILIRQANHNRGGVDIHTFHQTLYYYRYFIGLFNEQAEKPKIGRSRKELKYSIKRFKMVRKELQAMANGFGISKHFKWWLSRVF